MKHHSICIAALALAGCAGTPATPEQQEFLRRWVLEQQRHNNQMVESMPTTVVAPAQLQTQPLPVMAPLAQSAFWTGRSQLGQSVTGVAGTNCEYNYAGKTFWRMFAGGCPSSVTVR